MRGDELLILVSIVVAVGGCITIFSVHTQKRSAERIKRLELMEQALQHPSTDAVTRGELLKLLAEDHKGDKKSAAATFQQACYFGRVVLMAAGWLMFLGGASLLFISETQIMGSVPSQPGWTFLILGFMAMSLPVAVRELLNRSGPVPVKQS